MILYIKAIFAMIKLMLMLLSMSICRLLVHVHGDGAALLFQGDSHLARQAGRRDVVAQCVKAVSCKLSWHHHHVGGGTSQALLWTSGDW